MTPERREQLRQELDLVMDAIDATTEEKKLTVKDFTAALKNLRERQTHIRRVLKGREPDQPELPGIAAPPPAAPAPEAPPVEPPPPAPTRFELVAAELDAPPAAPAPEAAPPPPKKRNRAERPDALRGGDALRAKCAKDGHPGFTDGKCSYCGDAASGAV